MFKKMRLFAIVIAGAIAITLAAPAVVSADTGYTATEDMWQMSPSAYAELVNTYYDGYKRLIDTGYPRDWAISIANGLIYTFGQDIFYNDGFDPKTSPGGLDAKYYWIEMAQAEALMML